MAAGLLQDLRSALDRLTRPPVATVAAGVVLTGLLGIFTLHLAGLEPPSGGRLDIGTGDFLAFWTGAVAVHDGTGTSLYDFEAQKDLQTRIIGGRNADFQAYLNPPLLALLLAPLVPLGYLRAFFVFDAACAAGFLAGFFALRSLVPALAAKPLRSWTLFLAMASFQPMLQTMLGGQNTPLTFALLALLGLALARNRNVAAGIVLGLLSYKPQYALGIGVALAMSGRFAVLAASVPVGLAHYAAGAFFCGLPWPLQMSHFMAEHRPLELARNGGTHFSLPRVADYLLPSPFDGIVGIVGSALVLALFWNVRGRGRRGDPAWFAFVLCGTMLISPHLQYYDSAILLLPVAILVGLELDRGDTPPLRARLLLAAVYAGYPLWEAYRVIGVQPLFLVLSGVAFASWKLLSDEASPSAHRAA